MTIKILGSGCPPCQQLEANAKKAVEELGLKDVQVEHVYDIDKIIAYGVMFTPAHIRSFYVFFHPDGNSDTASLNC